MRGRKPKPTALRILEGNPGKRPINDAEPVPPPPDAEHFTIPPAALADHPVAQEEWTRLAPLLLKARQITEADRTALIALCLEWARYLDATRAVKRLGLVVKAPSGYPIMNPYLPIATKALSACNKLWPELGLTPSSRSRVRMAEPGSGIGDAFSEFDLPPALPPRPS